MNRHRIDGIRGCPMGCKTLCTIQHVILGECIGCEEQGQTAKKAMMEAITRIDTAMLAIWGKEPIAKDTTKDKTIRAIREAAAKKVEQQRRSDVRGQKWLQHGEL